MEKRSLKGWKKRRRIDPAWEAWLERQRGVGTPFRGKREKKKHSQGPPWRESGRVQEDPMEEKFDREKPIEGCRGGAREGESDGDALGPKEWGGEGLKDPRGEKRGGI